MIDEKGFVDNNFKKGIYEAVKSFDPNFCLNIKSLSEQNITQVFRGAETGKKEKIDIYVEFQNENATLELMKQFTDPPYTEMTLNCGENEVFLSTINDDGSITVEYENGYIYFPKMSIKGYYYSKETIENFEKISGLHFDSEDFAQYMKDDFRRNYTKPDDVIVPRGINLKSKLEAIFNYIQPVYEKYNNPNQK